MSCAFPHAVGHSMGWVEAPFPPARMGLSVLCCCRCADANGLSGHTAEAVGVGVVVFGNGTLPLSEYYFAHW
jgi:hypothetical protein